MPNLRVMVAKSARFRRASAGSGDLVPAVGKRNSGTACHWVCVNYNFSGVPGQIDAPPGSGCQRHVRKARTGKMRARAVVNRNGKVWWKLRVGAVGHINGK